ncbi:MFS transporter [Streptomyces boncukensis]|uniref:MFS transporter n=1 Tax=Streptomyces boncukensis TaxID=2711219 RepID=A0A6G4WVR9_9ACTN|nr:MFS transporter [Streptomyces boncukensis]NGO68697.1 MFS transporter [Streptomyces boncukensis]
MSARVEGSAETPSSPGGPGKGHPKRWMALGILCVAALVISVDLTVLQLAIPSLTEELDPVPTASQILWIADIYGLVMAGLLVSMGIIGDRIGRKKLLVIGAVVFAAASAVIAWSPNPESLIAGRALLGIGGATIYPTTLSIIRDMFTDAKERSMAVGIWTGMVSGGTAIGPVVGGPLLDNFWWGSVFLINLPLMAIVFVGALTLVPESRNPLPGRLDLFSVVLSVVGIMGIVYAIQESARDGLDEPKIIAAGLVGLVALVLFLWRQGRIENPILDVTLFHNRAFSGAFAANTFTMFASVGSLLLVSQYLQYVHDWSPMRAALALLPPAVMGMICAPFVGLLIPRMGQGRVVALGLGLLALAMFLYSFTGVDAGYQALLIPTIVHGMAAACIFACTVVIIINSAPPEKSGIASGIATTGGELGAAMGMSVLGTILNTVYHHSVDVPSELSGEAAHAVGDSVGAALEVAAQAPASVAGRIVDTASSSFMDGMHAAVLTNAGILLTVCVITLVALRGLPKTFEEHSEETGAEDGSGSAGESVPAQTPGRE